MKSAQRRRLKNDRVLLFSNVIFSRYIASRIRRTNSMNSDGKLLFGASHITRTQKIFALIYSSARYLYLLARTREGDGKNIHSRDTWFFLHSVFLEAREKSEWITRYRCESQALQFRFIYRIEHYNFYPYIFVV